MYILLKKIKNKKKNSKKFLSLFLFPLQSATANRVSLLPSTFGPYVRALVCVSVCVCVGRGVHAINYVDN